MGEICDIQIGKTPNRSEPRFWGGVNPWLSIRDMNQGRELWETAEYITDEAVEEQKCRLVRPGTLLLSFKLSIGKVSMAQQPMYTNEAIAQLPILAPDVDRDYLYWALRTVPLTGEVDRAAMGATLNKAKLKRIPIPLPPIEEQRRIAAVLDAADDLRAQRREALAKLGTLTQAIFSDMFGDPAANPMRWQKMPLGRLALKFSDGPFGSNLKSDHYQDGGVRVVRLQNIGNGEFVDDVAAYISTDHFATLAKHECRPGDVLIATMGDPNLRACIQPAWLEVALNKADCVQIRVDPTTATSPWLCALLNHPSTEELAQSLVRGQTRSRISMGRLRELAVPVPPLELQREFDRRYEATVSQTQRCRDSSALLDTLFASLQYRAFRGEL